MYWRKVVISELNNIPSERLIIGGILQHGLEAFVEASSLLDTESFSDAKHQQIYEVLKLTMQTVEVVDMPSFFSAAKNLGLAKQFEDGHEYLNSLKAQKVELENVRKHAAIVRRLQFARELQETMREGFKKLSNVTGNETLNDIQAIGESPLQDLCLRYQKGDESAPELIGDGLREYVQNLIDNPDTMKGISTGYTILDMMLGGGCNRQCVDVIAARKKEGKSIICDNVAHFVCQQDIPVLVLDTEMKKSEHYDRLLAKIARISINEISQARFTKDPTLVNKIWAATEELERLPYTYKKVAGKRFTEILSIIRRWLLQTVKYDSSGRLNDCLVIYDYFKINDSSEINAQMQSYQLLGFQMSQLKDFASEYDFPVLTFVQSNRSGITIEDSSIVAHSDSIMDTATSLTLFKSKTPEEIANDGGIRNGNKKFVGCMYRHGPGLENDYVNLRFEGEYGTLTELGTRNNMLEPSNSGQFETTIDEEDNTFD